jgi:hypothetical protein
MISIQYEFYAVRGLKPGCFGFLVTQNQILVKWSKNHIRGSYLSVPFRNLTTYKITEANSEVFQFMKTHKYPLIYYLFSISLKYFSFRVGIRKAVEKEAVVRKRRNKAKIKVKLGQLLQQKHKTNWKVKLA